MELTYKIIWIVAFTVNFCVAVINLRLILESWLTLTLNIQLEEKRIDRKADLILARESQKEWRGLNE
jgi:hypothetical protein